MSAANKAQELETPSYTPRRDQRIGRLLAEAGKLDNAHIGQVISLQEARGLRFGEAAVNLGLITPDDVRLALARQHDFPCPESNARDARSDLIVFHDPHSSRVEQLRSLRTQLLIRWSGLARVPRALAIVSPGSGEGRSLLTANLAVLFAQLRMRTLLIDADLRAPRQSAIFGIADRVGLAAVLTGRVWRDAAVPLPALGPLWVLPAGARPPNPQELLLRPELACFLELADDYDMILIDTPPARASADAHSVAFCAGGALVLARADHTRRDEATGLVRELTDAGALILGSVLNAF
jgi:chain length determinant protein tyrosine kinase EpsG